MGTQSTWDASCVRREGAQCRHLFFVSAMQFEEGEMLHANSSDARRKTVLKAVGVLLVCVFFVGGYVVSDGQEEDQDQLSELATWRNPFAFGDDGLATLTSLSQTNASKLNNSVVNGSNKTRVVYMTYPPTPVPTHVPTPQPPPISLKILCIPLPGQNI